MSSITPYMLCLLAPLSLPSAAVRKLPVPKSTQRLLVRGSKAVAMPPVIGCGVPVVFSAWKIFFADQEAGVLEVKSNFQTLPCRSPA